MQRPIPTIAKRLTEMNKFLLIFSFAFIAAGLTLSPLFDRRAAAQSGSPTPTPLSASPTTSRTPFIEDDSIIKIDTELVNLSVRVIDRNNRPINNVSEREFKIYEDGVLQKIDFFSRAEVPTNYALVIDNSGSLRQQLDKVVEAGKVFVNTNRVDDETMIIRFVGRDKIEIEQPFTSNKVDLNDALDNLYVEGGQTAVIDAVYLAAENVEEYKRTTGSVDKRRRALILVTDGEDRNSYYNEKQLFELLRESDVQIYVIGFVDDLSKEGGFIGKSPQGKAKALLERLASETGGKAYFPKSSAELPGLAREISNELRTQYSIGYIPSNDRKDGTYRTIKVQVDDGPGNQKRIAVSKAGRTAEGGGGTTPRTTPPQTKP